MLKRGLSDQFAMFFAIQRLESLNWTVLDLNTIQKNYPNSDLRITKGKKTSYVQVKGKLQKKMNWVGVGYTSDSKILAGRLFNTATGGTPCDVIMSVVMAAYDPNADVRFFVFPVEDAEAIFLDHALYHVSKPTNDGRKRSGNIELATFVGPGTHRVSNVLDQQERVLLYEGAFHHLTIT